MIQKKICMLGAFAVGKTSLLVDLVTATLDLSRLQSQQLPFTIQEVQVARLVEEVVTDIRYLNSKPTLSLYRKGINFSCVAPSGCEADLTWKREWVHALPIMTA
jgi:GTPase SAR1 family protein